MIREILRRAYRTILPLIYSKKNYKFFFTCNLHNLELKIQRIFYASNTLNSVLKPILVNPPFGKKVLILAPHHDDEAIGCGGAALAHVSKGGTLKTVIIQDGSGAHEALGMSRDELINIREEESRRCAEKMGSDSLEFLRIPRLEDHAIEELADHIRNILINYKPDTIFAPFPLDNDFEHANSSRALALALSGCKDNIEIYSYEVWGLCIPNVAVAVDEHIDKKEELINCFESQIRSNDYGHAFKGLAMYNSLQFGAIDIKYVERFFVLPASAYSSFVAKVFRG